MADQLCMLCSGDHDVRSLWTRERAWMDEDPGAAQIGLFCRYCIAAFPACACCSSPVAPWNWACHEGEASVDDPDGLWFRVCQDPAKICQAVLWGYPQLLLRSERTGELASTCVLGGVDDGPQWLDTYEKQDKFKAHRVNASWCEHQGSHQPYASLAAAARVAFADPYPDGAPLSRYRAQLAANVDALAERERKQQEIEDALDNNSDDGAYGSGASESGAYGACGDENASEFEALDGDAGGGGDAYDAYGPGGSESDPDGDYGDAGDDASELDGGVWTCDRCDAVLNDDNYTRRGGENFCPACAAPAVHDTSGSWTCARCDTDLDEQSYSRRDGEYICVECVYCITGA